MTTNLSAQFFINSSSSTALPFSYIIPYGQSQECDIYGPICQTGSINVGVNLTTTITDTVLPCSSYLLTQSQYLQREAVVGPDSPYLYEWQQETPDYWGINFGHSPECRSYAKAFIDGRYTISGCGDQDTVIQTASWAFNNFFPDRTLPQIPPGLMRPDSPDSQSFCCGNCTLWDLPEVRVYYFLDSNTTECRYNQSFNSTSISSARNLAKRVHSNFEDESVAIVNGNTLLVYSCYLSDFILD